MHNPLAQGTEADEWLELYIDVQIELQALEKSWEHETYIDNIYECETMYYCLRRYIDKSKKLYQYLCENELYQYLTFNSWAFYDAYKLDKEGMQQLITERKADLEKERLKKYEK